MKTRREVNSVLTKLEMILLAAAELARNKKVPFTAADLVVQTFRSFPKSFCLEGHPEYPDSNQLFVTIMGRTAPMMKRGWLQKIGTRKYTITPKGLEDAASLTGSKPDPSVIDPKWRSSIVRLLKSPAFEKFQRKRGDEITFREYCEVLDLSVRDRPQRLLEALANADYLAEKVAEIAKHNGTLEAQHKLYDVSDLVCLSKMIVYLRKRYEKEIATWQNREV